MTTGISSASAPRAARPTARRSHLVVLVIVFLVVVVGTILDRFFGIAGVENLAGESVPLLNPGLWPFGFGAGLLGILIVVALTAAAVRRGAWTAMLAGWRAAITLTTSIAASMALSAGFIFNPEFVDIVFEETPHIVIRLMGIVIGALTIAGGIAVAAMPYVRMHRAQREAEAAA